MKRRAAALAGLLLAACSSTTPPATENVATDSSLLQRDGRWMVDSDHRVHLLHGVNAVWKVAPYAPSANADGFTAADADFLAANGFNAVRLGVLFAGVMPQQGVLDASYLDQVDRVVQLLASRHIWVLLDFHQDMLNEKYQGEGFPAWAVDDGGLPNDAREGFPADEFVSLALNTAFDNFWSNKNAVWTPYDQALAAAAQRWHNQPYLLGYDMFNEPWPGTQWPTCFEMDCTRFDATLQQFYTQALAAVRSADAQHLAFFEPQQLFDFGAPSGYGPVADANIGLSWHDYCSVTLTASANLPVELPDCTIIEPRTMNNADNQISAMGATTLITEFGATDDTTDIGRVADLADQHLTGWTYWAYKNWGDPTGGAVEGLFTDDSDLTTLKSAKADVLIRPYAQAVAGVPTAMSFDATGKTFALTYTPRATTLPTEIFVPARHYPAGYQAQVTGGHVTSPDNATLLEVVADGSSAVQVTVTPR
ncbi:MAG TPA: cellulase family glycosylhydrolase [Nevskiaceae bacterium]|nr:cellulase family glycosylhydrolase [Nevskiaceae bacterium]